MNSPAHILLATQHPDPYAYYAALRDGPPVAFDPLAGVWVVSGAAAVRQALGHPALGVQPAAEPVPRALAGTRAGEVFGLLVRMNDGAFHATHRPALQAGVARWSQAAVADAAAVAALDLVGRMSLDDWLCAVPVQAVARLLDVAPAQLDTTVAAVQAFTRGIAAGAGPRDIAQADSAAGLLMVQGERLGLDRVAAANRIALMQQALDATAGLIGNTLAWLHARPDAASSGFADLVDTVSREDPAIHHTRRWAARNLVLEGAVIAEGSGLVILLAGVAPFGLGPHACPGERIAQGLASAALEALHHAGRLPDLTGTPRRWRPLANARIPVFTP